MSLILQRAYREDPKQFDGTATDRRDPDYIREFLPLLELMWRYYFRVSARGFEHAPAGEPFLVVGNHNGGINTPDAAMTLHGWCRQHGPDAPMYALMQPGIFTVPYLNVHAMKLGGLAASARTALRVLESGAPLMLYPGAGDDAYKPFRDRHRILFFGRDAFVRLALRLDIPILPVVTVGAHETLIVFDDGRERARELGLDQQGVERLPLTFSFPYGLALGTPFNVPFPVQIDMRMGPPIRFAGAGPKAANDPAKVKRGYDAVVHVMQAMMDRMVAERAAKRHPAATA